MAVDLVLIPETPKPMLPMGSERRRLIDFSLETCSENCENIYVTTGYKAEQVEEYIKNKSKVVILRDDRVVGNGGSLVEHREKILETIGMDLLVIPGDHVLSGFPINAFVEHHRKMNADITLMVVSPKPYGEYIVFDKEKVEKIVFTKTENCKSTIGIYLISRNYLINWIKTRVDLGWNGEELCVTKDIIHPAVGTARIETFLLPDSAYWDDAGTIERYHYNNMLLSKDENVIDEKAKIHPESGLKRCVVVGGIEIRNPVVLEDSIISSSTKNELQITRLK